MAKKVQFGLSNVHFSIVDVDENGAVTFGVPHKQPGAVNLTLEVNGSVTPFYADNIVYYQATSNQGYTGTMELAMVDEWFRLNVLKEIKDANALIVENANANPSPIAVMYQVESDENPTRRVLYYVQVSRMGETSATKGETTEPQTVTLNITATPLPDTQDVMARTSDDTPQSVYNNWFTAVQIRGGSFASDTTLSALSLGALTLTPTFDPAVTSYTAETTNATNTLTATPNSAGAKVTIEANGAPVTNGSAITWDEGENTVNVTVTNGEDSTVYTIGVNKTS